MKGLILDEEKLAKLSGFVCLTHRIFPHVLNSFTPEDLNKSYHMLKLASANATELPGENSLCRSTHKKAAISKPAPRAQSRSAKKKSGHTSDIYDTKRKLWQWVDVVPRRINKGINKAMEMYFSCPTPLKNEPEGVLVHQETVQATCTDIKDSGMSTEGSSCLRKGTAYNGDLSRDKDYFCRNGRQKDNKPLVKNQFLAVLNSLSATVLQHLNECDHIVGANVGVVSAPLCTSGS